MGKNESESMKGQYREGCKGGWGGGRKYNKQGSAYAINREAIHRKDRGRGSARKGEGREGGVKGKEGRGKGGEHEEGEEGMRKGGHWQVWLQLHAQFPSCTM